MDLFSGFLDCICGSSSEDDSAAEAKVHGDMCGPPLSREETRLVDEIVAAIRGAEKVGDKLRAQVTEMVDVSSWTDTLALALLTRLEQALRESRQQMGGALKEAYDTAMQEAGGFAHDHPVFTTLIALGVLVVLLPWVIEALGFAELGPVEGT